MIVFDVDGTLVGGEAVDWRSFDTAFQQVAGFTLTRSFFDNLEEVTAQSIIHRALCERPVEEIRKMEKKVMEGFVKNLKAAHQNDQACFPPTKGALKLLRTLKENQTPIAVATGDWRESITFKLHAAGISHHDITMMTSSEYFSRAEIIASAVERSGGALDNAIYVGDGLWDYRACQILGIPFIGVGRRHELLRQAGASHVLPDLEPPEFLRVVSQIRESR